MSIAVQRKVGRPTAIETELVNWAVVVAEQIQEQQRGLDFVASGDSLADYGVVISQRNVVEIVIADYLKYSVAGRGRQPGGGFPPVNAIVDWLETKGIEPPDDMSLESFAFIIARKQQREGNTVFRGGRPGIPVDLIIAESFDDIKSEMSFNVAAAAAAELVANIKSFKVK
jgi:hypothetical protein